MQEKYGTRRVVISGCRDRERVASVRDMHQSMKRDVPKATHCQLSEQKVDTDEVGDDINLFGRQGK